MRGEKGWAGPTLGEKPKGKRATRENAWWAKEISARVI
jgi:hypothetical protein